MPHTTSPRLCIGTSGYQYAHWRGTFYPEKLAKKEWFAHYSQPFLHASTLSPELLR